MPRPANSARTNLPCTYLNDPTLADAILDRVVHSSHKIELKGTRSMRDGDAAAAM